MSDSLSDFLSRLGIILLLFLLAACGAGAPQSAQRLVSIDTPLGFSWDKFVHEGTEFGPNPLVRCQAQVDELSSVIPPRMRGEVVEQCFQQKYRDIHLAPETLPSDLSDGEVSVTVKGRSEPVVFNYSYFHRLYVDPEHEANTKKRLSRARKLEGTLVKMYGPAQTSGYFDQFMVGGFVPQGGGDQSCSLWVEQDIGIMLCAERIVLIDGIEMSLTFIKLSQVPYGDYLRCVAIRTNPSSCSDMLRSDPDQHPNGDTNFLEVLSDWLGEASFRSCEASNLSPLETASALTPEIEVEAKRIVGEYRKEALVEYVFGSGLKSDQLIMYLLRASADDGSASAMNEIGASLLYCYQSVEQDPAQAAAWLKSASDLGDPYAMKSLALMHMRGMMDSSDGLIEAVILLVECERIDEMNCDQELRATRELIDQLSEDVSPD